MARSALTEISSMHALARAWSSVWANSSAKSRSTSGSDGVTLSDFSAKRDLLLRGLSSEIRRSAGYQFSPLATSLIPKPNGGYRVICIPTVADRVVQRAVVDFLADGDKCGIVNNVSYGFIKGRSVEDAAKKVKHLRSRYGWAYKADIAKFFDNIDRNDLSSAIKASVKTASLYDILTRAASCEIEKQRPTRDRAIRKAGIQKGKGVRQGMPLSPLFANILLRNFDKAIEKAGFNMVRYADDLIVLCNTEADCHAAHKFIRDELAKLGLSIADPGTGGKTRIYKPSETAEFLGVGLVPNGAGYSLNVLQEQTDSVRNRLAQMADFAYLAKEGITIGKFDRQLTQIIDGFNEAYRYCDNIGQFEKALDDARNDAMARLYKTGLGIDVSKLTPEQRQFLGLV